MLVDNLVGDVHEADSSLGEPETEDSIKLRGAEGTVDSTGSINNQILAEMTHVA